MGERRGGHRGVTRLIGGLSKIVYVTTRLGVDGFGSIHENSIVFINSFWGYIQIPDARLARFYPVSCASHQ